MPIPDPTGSHHHAHNLIRSDAEASQFNDAHQIDTDELDQVNDPDKPTEAPPDANFTLWEV